MLSDYEKLTDWKPIETAPKDGTRILAYFPGNDDPELFFKPMIAVASWRELSPTVNWELVDEDQELWRRSITTPAFFESDDSMVQNPTHWMPLPNPPASQSLDTRERTSDE